MTKDLVQQQFGAHAAAYATSTVHAKGASLGRLVELVKPQPQWQALDIATGAGHTAAAFAPHVARVVASDLTEEMLEESAKLAKSKGFANMETARADAEALPFSDAQLRPRHLPHRRASLPGRADLRREVWRVLRAGRHLRARRQHLARCGSTPGFSECRFARCGAHLQRLREDPRPQPRPLPRHGRVDRGALRHRLQRARQGAHAQGHGVPALGRADGLRSRHHRASARHARRTARRRSRRSSSRATETASFGLPWMKR